MPRDRRLGDRQRRDRLGMLADQRREADQPGSTARASCGLRPVRPTARASAEVGRGGGAKRPPPAAAAPAVHCALRQGQRVEPLEQSKRYCSRTSGSAIARDMVEQPPPEAGLLLRAWSSGSASSSCRHSLSTSDSGRSSRASSAARPPVRIRSSGILAGAAG